MIPPPEKFGAVDYSNISASHTEVVCVCIVYPTSHKLYQCCVICTRCQKVKLISIEKFIYCTRIIAGGHQNCLFSVECPYPMLPPVTSCTCIFHLLLWFHIFEVVWLHKKKSEKDSLSFIWTNIFLDESRNSQGNLELLFLAYEEETEINFVPLERAFLFLELLLCY